MQIGPVGDPISLDTWSDQEVDQCLQALASIDQKQTTLTTGIQLLESDMTNMQEYAVRTSEHQVFIVLLFGIYFGYLISHYFLPKVTQLGGST